MQTSVNNNISISKRRIRKRDKPPVEQISLDTFYSVLLFLDVWCREFEIKRESLTVLLVCIEYHLRTGKSLSTMLIHKRIMSLNNSYKSTSNKIDTLVKRGLLDHVGYGYLKCNLFAPTQKAIESLNALVDLVNE